MFDEDELADVLGQRPDNEFFRAVEGFEAWRLIGKWIGAVGISVTVALAVSAWFFMPVSPAVLIAACISGASTAALWVLAWIRREVWFRRWCAAPGPFVVSPYDR